MAVFVDTFDGYIVVFMPDPYRGDPLRKMLFASLVALSFLTLLIPLTYAQIIPMERLEVGNGDIFHIVAPEAFSNKNWSIIYDEEYLEDVAWRYDTHFSIIGGAAFYEFHFRALKRGITYITFTNEGNIDNKSLESITFQITIVRFSIKSHIKMLVWGVEEMIHFLKGLFIWNMFY